MRVATTALLLLIGQFATAQTTTNCYVNGQWIRCTSQPSVVVLPPRPNPIGEFLEKLSADLKAKDARAKEDQKQVAMILATQFAQFPVDVQVANYEKLPDDVKQYVLDPRLFAQSAQPA